MLGTNCDRVHNLFTRRLPPSGRLQDMVVLLILVIVVGLSFDFTNGFHDTANAVATSIATGALKPRQAVILSAVFNMIGAFISISVATKIASGLISTIGTTVRTND